MFQISGFAILIDRRNGTWQDLTSVFYKIISQFPGDIKEVFLLYKYPSGKTFDIWTRIQCPNPKSRRVPPNPTPIFWDILGVRFWLSNLCTTFSSRKANAGPAGRQRLPPWLRHLPRVGHLGAPPLRGREVLWSGPWYDELGICWHVDTDSAPRGQVHPKVILLLLVFFFFFKMNLLTNDLFEKHSN